MRRDRGEVNAVSDETALTMWPAHKRGKDAAVVAWVHYKVLRSDENHSPSRARMEGIDRQASCKSASGWLAAPK